MKELTRSTFDQLHELFQSYNPKFAIYRGVSDVRHELIPAAGRMLIRSEFNRRDIERFILKTFKERSVTYLQYSPGNDWEWLALAQHHGLPTRLLDWTRNPLVALYFAVRKPQDSDCAVYVIREETLIGGPDEWDQPIEMGGLPFRYIPSHVTSRIIAQSGLFTFHPNPEHPYDSDAIDKIVIPNAMRGKLKQVLYRYGVHQASMFPGLDGLAEHVKWMNEDGY